MESILYKYARIVVYGILIGYLGIRILARLSARKGSEGGRKVQTAECRGRSVSSAQ